MIEALEMGDAVSKIVERLSLPLGPGGRPVDVPSPLSCVVKRTGGRDGERPLRIVVALHGYGDSARNFSELAGEFALPDTLWVIPCAPDAVPMTADGAQWYDLFSASREQVARSSASVDALLGALLDASQAPLTALPVVLLGFSQGAYLSLYTAVRSNRRLAAVVALSGYLAQTHRTPLPLPFHVQETPFFVAHGLHDNVVLPTSHFEAVDALEHWGCAKTVGKTYPVAHSLHPKEIADVRAFLLEHTSLEAKTL
jgi:predicted esterase